MLLTLPNFLTVIKDRAQELALSSYTDAEIVRYMDQATQDIRRRHDWIEVRGSTDLSFTKSATLPYATVSAPSDWWAPSYLNNSDEDYYFWWAEPDTIRQLVRDGRHSYEDVESAFAKDGSNLLIYHDVTETLTLKYYSKYLVLDNDGSTTKEQWASNGTDTDTFRLENDELLVVRTLMWLAAKEPNSKDDYALLKQEFEQMISDEKILNPSQRPMRLEPLQFVG